MVQGLEIYGELAYRKHRGVVFVAPGVRHGVRLERGFQALEAFRAPFERSRMTEVEIYMGSMLPALAMRGRLSIGLYGDGSLGSVGIMVPELRPSRNLCEEVRDLFPDGPRARRVELHAVFRIGPEENWL